MVVPKLAAGAGVILFPLVLLRASETADRDSGQVCFYNKEYSRAAVHFQEALRSNPGSIPHHRGYQDALLAGGEASRPELRRHYRQRLDTDSTNPDLLYLYGRCLDCIDGEKFFDAALRRDPCHAWTLNAQGACSFERGDFRSAKQQFLKAIRCRPDFTDAYRNLAHVYLKEDEQQRAFKVYRRLVERDRRNPKVYEWIGDVYLAVKDLHNAAQAYRKSASLGARGPGLPFKLGYVSFELGKLAEAAKYYQKSADAGNRTPEFYYNLAVTLEQMDYPAEALDKYKKAYERNADYKILYAIGNCAVKIGLHTKAIQSYEAFLKREPRNTEALFGLANAYQIRKDFARAVETYQRIIAIDGNFSKAYYNLGSIYAYHVPEDDKRDLYWGAYIRMSSGNDDARFVQREMQRLGEKVKER